MDINDLRSLFTVVTVLMFVAIVWWAYSSRRTQAFEEAAMLPLSDEMEELHGASQVSRNTERNS